MVVEVVPVALNIGAEGAVVSGIAVVTFTALLFVVLPAASMAFTTKVYVVENVKPVIA